MFARVCVVFALLALACLGGVRASSVDSWAAAPAALADAWPQELNAPQVLSANEMEMRHAEFLMTLGASSSSSTGPAEESSSTGSEESSSTGPVVGSSSSSTGPAANGTSSSSSSSSSSTGAAGPSYGNATVLSAYDRNSSNPIANLSATACEAIKNQTGFPNVTKNEYIACSDYFIQFGEVIISNSRRRLLQLKTDEVQQLKIVFTPGNIHDPVASQIAQYFGEQLKCGTNDTCREVKAAAAGFQPLVLPEEVMANLIQGSVQVENGELNGADPTARPTVSPDGSARRTNGGYYFLAAVLALFIVIAAVYFVMHKAPASAAYQEDAATRRGAGEEVAMAPVGPAAGDAPASGVVVADEAAPLGGQQQMDYRSVFALKHNVLERKEEAKAEDDEQTHNDVHFILHQ